MLHDQKLQTTGSSNAIVAFFSMSHRRASKGFEWVPSCNSGMCAATTGSVVFLRGRATTAGRNRNCMKSGVRERFPFALLELTKAGARRQHSGCGTARLPGWLALEKRGPWHPFIWRRLRSMGSWLERAKKGLILEHVATSFATYLR